MMQDSAGPIFSTKENFFLKGDGEMATLVRAKDWANTPLGDLETWPQSLRTMVAVVLNNPFGMYLAWGKEYTQIYNDAYRPILGISKHPEALGIGTKETFKEIWHIIGPMFEDVMNGQAVGYSDFMLPLNRNGFVEECFFDFSYSPITNDNGEVGGVLVTVIETTNKKKVEDGLKESKDQLEFAIEATELATWDYNPATNKFTSNKRLKEWFGLSDEYQIDLQQAFLSIAQKDQQRIATEIEKSLQFVSGGKYDIEFTIVHPVTLKKRVVRTKGKAWFNENKIGYRLNGTMQDITEQVEVRMNIENSEEQLRIALEGGELGTFDFFPLEEKLLWSAKTKEFFGLPPEANVNMGIYMQGLHPADRNTSNEIAQQKTIIQNGGLYDLEYRTIGITDGRLRWLRSKGKVTYDANNRPVRFTGVVQDITKRKQAEEELLKNEQQKRAMIETAPFPIGVYIGKEMRIQFANQSLIDIWAKGKDVIGKSFKTILPELEKQDVFKKLDDVYLTGISYHAKNQQVDIVKNGKTETYYFNYSFTPLIDAAGITYGVMNTAAEVTDLILAKSAIQKSEQNLRNIISQAPVAMCIFKGDNFIVDLANERMFEFWGKTAAEVMHQPIFEALPESTNQGFEAILQEVYSTGKTFAADRVPITLPRNGEVELVYVNFVYEPYREADGMISGILAVAIDVTAQITAIKKIEESEKQFRIFADSIQNLAWITTSDGWVYWYNQRWYDYTGLQLEEMEGWGWLKVHHPDHIDKVSAFIEEAWKKGEAWELTFPLRRFDGAYHWFLTRAYPIKDSNGNIERWIGTNTDITTQKNFSAELEKLVNERTIELNLKNQTFEAAEKIAKFGSYRWNLNTGALEYSDNLFRLLDCEPKEFEPSFEKFLTFVHPDDLDQVLRDGEMTLKTEALEEKPYRIISKNGTVKHFRTIGSFRGDNNNRILFGTVQDVSREIKVAEELRAKNLELENTNAELTSFTYVASHDLQEPLRKIQLFSKHILECEQFSVKTQHNFNRIIAAGQRMQNLIVSLLDFSRMSATEIIFEPCNLNTILAESIEDLQVNINEKQAVVEYHNLPVVSGSYIQLLQLFTNLIDNAIKYSKPGVKPIIRISSSIVQGKDIENFSAHQKEYHLLKMKDNGIGFEKEYANKIFEIFQRLHGKHEYSGTGIGLAIVKKIVTNHNGFIVAEGFRNIGSTFSIYIPKA